MQACDLLVEVLRQYVDADRVLVLLHEQLDLGQDLIGEGIGHHEARMTGRAAQVHQTAAGQQRDAVPVREDDLVHLGLDLDPLVLAQLVDLDLVVEVTDVADDGLILHLPHVVFGDDVLVAGGGDEDVGLAADVIEVDDAVALHRRLQRADRVDLSDPDIGAEPAQRGRRALAHIAVAADDGDLAGDHDIGRPLDRVDQGLAAAVQVVELGLGDRVVDVHRREQQRALLVHLVETVHAGGGLFGDALDALGHVLPMVGVAVECATEHAEHGGPFLVVVGGGLGHAAGLLVLHTLVHQQGRITSVVEDHVRAAAVGPIQHLLGAPPVFLQCLALPGVDRDAAGGDGRGGMILSREDVARAPAHLGAELDQRLDQHRGLDGHVQAAGDARPLEGLARAVLGAQCHQARHLGLGNDHLLAAEIGQ